MSTDIVIRPILRSEVEAVQSVFNHKDVIAGLGGFTMTDTVKNAAFGNRPGLLAAWDGTTPVGAIMVGGRPQVHLLKYGSVGVLPEYRRRRISTALYFGLTLQGILEGRRLFEDTIVGDNAAQQVALPTMGLSLAGTLRHRTASAKSILLYQLSLVANVPSDYRASLGLDVVAPFICMYDRVVTSKYRFHYFLDDNAITRDWYVKNKEIVDKHPAELKAAWEDAEDTRSAMRADTVSGMSVTVVKDREIAAAPQRGQKKPAAQELSFFDAPTEEAL